MTDKQRFSSVWDAIEDTPQRAASMRARSDLMLNLTEVIRERGWGEYSWRDPSKLLDRVVASTASYSA